MQFEEGTVTLPKWLLRLRAVMSVAVAVVCVAFALFHFIDATKGLGSFELLTGHLMFAFLVTFFMVPAVKNPKSKGVALVDVTASILLALLSIFSMLYSLYYHLYLARWHPGRITHVDIVVGILMVFLTLEATRRHHGMMMPVIALFSIAYAFVGRYLPTDLLSHRGFDFERVFTFIGPNTTEGILGVPLSASATYVAMFLFFSTFLSTSGLGDLFSDIAFKLTGRFRGGPAKSSVIASCLFGMISGSAVANVMVDGWLTIGLMKKVGYKPHFAGAVEAVASTGGQFMPPVMGAAAFIMAELLGISYAKVCLVAFIPAFLYYWGLLWAVDFQAVRLGLKGLDKAELPPANKIWSNIYMILPVLLLIYLLIYLDWSPGKAAFWSIVCIWITSMIKSSTRMGPRKLMKTVTDGARSVADIATICACAGIIVGVFGMTGLGLRLSSVLVYISHNSLPLLAFLTMIVALILGMGVTTSAVYIILATLVAPAMVSLGVNPMAAHLFVLYFGCISVITPPVAVAAYAAAGIAGSDPWKTGWVATRLAIAGYIIPFIFIYDNGMIGLGRPIDVILTVIEGLIAVFLLAAGSEGYLLRRAGLWQRVSLIAGAILIIVPNQLASIIGFILAGLVVFAQLVTNRKKKNELFYKTTSIS